MISTGPLQLLRELFLPAFDNAALRKWAVMEAGGPPAGFPANSNKGRQR